MVVREAIFSDRSKVIELLRESHLAARFTFQFDPAYADKLFRQHLESDRGVVLVIEGGVLMAAAYQHPFGMGLIAKETVWFIAPQARGKSALLMLDAYEAWARSHGCVAIGMASLATNDVSKIYERRGYFAAETHFLKTLN